MENGLDKALALLLNLDHDELVELLEALEKELDKRIIEVDNEG